MNEKTFWSSHVRKALNVPPKWRAYKVQDAFNSGLPDVAFCLEGRSGLIELKYVPKKPVRESSRIAVKYRPAQPRFLQGWNEAGGLGLVLLGVEREWFLFREQDQPKPLLKRHLIDPAHWIIDHGTLKTIKRDLPNTLIDTFDNLYRHGYISSPW